MAKCNVIKHRHQTQAAVAPFYALRRTNLARYAKKERKKERKRERNGLTVTTVSPC